MYQCIKILCVTLLFPYVSHATGISTPLSVGVVSFDKSAIQISTTKNTVLGDNILICSSIKKSCDHYQGSDFSSVTPNNAVEDVATGKSIYTYSYSNTHRQELQAGISLALIFDGREIQAKDIEFDGINILKIQNKQIRDVISYCTSSEGVHVLSQPRDIHLYYTLGYEVEANCPDEVYQ